MAPSLLFWGEGSLAESVDPTLEAADALSAVNGVRFLPAVRRGNVMGALDMGMSPGLLPGRTSLEAGTAAFAAAWGKAPEAPGLNTSEILRAAADGDIDVVVLLGADPVADGLDPELANAALAKIPMVISVDLFSNDSNRMAHVVLPAAAFTEASGSHTNLEGRISPIRQLVTPPGTARADWMIAVELADRMDADLGLTSACDVWSELAPLSSVHGELTATAIDDDPDGVLITAQGRVSFVSPTTKVETQAVDAYALRLATRRRMYDQGTVVNNSHHLEGLGGEAAIHVNSYDFNRLGVAGGEPVHVVSASGALDLSVVADDGVPRGVALIDYNRSGADARSLFDSDSVCVDVRLETGS